MKAPPVAASEALGGCSFLEAESCKAIYADLRPRGILARETIHNKLSAFENQVRPVAGNSPSLPALCPDPLFACDRSFPGACRQTKGREMFPALADKHPSSLGSQLRIA